MVGRGGEKIGVLKDINENRVMMRTSLEENRRVVERGLEDNNTEEKKNRRVEGDSHKGEQELGEGYV